MTYEEWKSYLDQSLKEQGTNWFIIGSLPDVIRYKKMIDAGVGLGDINRLGKVAPRILKKRGLDLSTSQISHNRAVETYERVL
ncbi:MAG: hypothetical protein SVK08_01145 [Halobacteriota archaeon]|nr:hypothetical protein [Halobacteriota archaeon]